MNPNTKLKDYRYQIAGTDSNRPLYECLQAIAVGAFVVIATIGLCFAAVFASDIDNYLSTILP